MLNFIFYVWKADSSNAIINCNIQVYIENSVNPNTKHVKIFNKKVFIWSKWKTKVSFTVICLGDDLSFAWVTFEIKCKRLNRIEKKHRFSQSDETIFFSLNSGKSKKFALLFKHASAVHSRFAGRLKHWKLSVQCFTSVRHIESCEKHIRNGVVNLWMFLFHHRCNDFPSRYYNRSNKIAVMHGNQHILERLYMVVFGKCSQTLNGKRTHTKKKCIKCKLRLTHPEVEGNGGGGRFKKYRFKLRK